MITIKDPGHHYTIKELDGDGYQQIQFVKRQGDHYPGNLGVRPGITLQQILRICIDRIYYLHKQIPHWVNPPIIKLLQLSVWLLEFRAHRRRGEWYLKTPTYSSTAPMCKKCGHTVCSKHHKRRLYNQ